MIMLDIFGNKSETSLEKFTEAENSFGIFKNGIFKKVKNDLGTFTYKVQDMPDFNGLTEECVFDFERSENIPKMPYTIFESILDFYKDVYNEIKSEVYCIVLWDKIKKDFIIHVPSQVVSGAAVKYERNPEIYSNTNLVPYFETHSHNVMGAFFSGTDVQDEVAARYFGVFGKILNEVPELAAKIAFNRQFKSLSYEDLFDVEVEKLHPNSDYSLDYNDYKDLIKENIKTIPAYKPSTAAYPYKKNEFAKSTPEDLEYYSSYRSSNTYNDYDDHDELYSFRYVDNIDPFLKGTIFEKEPEELSLFSFDFRKIFSKNALQSNCYSDIHNLYASMTNLLIDTFPDELELDSLQRTANEAITDSLSLINLGNDTDDNVD